ncbi:RNA polymerase sigma factor [Niabella ginsengisoli]|uniref:RNA polymerase sigma factor n=1 Tax=Niabella ginsengisoli TaxID=522298 RepID=UPI0021D42220|nr:sigma-70 family RNA polymerase sigma factor [Niabella ginsengisoli]
MVSEEILVEQLKQGDEAAFKHIVDTYQNMVYNTCLGIVKSEEDAEDLAQEVFVQVYQSINSFKGESKFSTWLYRIATTKSLDHERKRSEKSVLALLKAFLERMRRLK